VLQCQINMVNKNIVLCMQDVYVERDVRTGEKMKIFSYFYLEADPT
jgi:hypothetical protein